MGLLLNRAKANTATTGTGAVTPGGAVTPFQTWSAAGATSGNWYDYLIEDGAAWEMGVGLYNGTTITRGGPGVDPWFTSSTGALLNLSGSATIACVANKDTLTIGGGPFMPPLASSFTTASGDATLPTLTNNASVGLIFDGGTPVAGDKLRVAYRTLTTKASDWTMVARMPNATYLNNANYSGAGLLLWDSVAGRSTVLDIQSNSAFLQVLNFSNLITYSATPASASPSGNFPNWYRVRQVSSTYYFDFSSDGVNWSNLYSVASTTWLTNRADRVGLSVHYNRATGPNNVLDVQYFSLTGPGV